MDCSVVKMVRMIVFSDGKIKKAAYKGILRYWMLRKYEKY